MTTPLADALAEVNEPETIANILEAVDYDYERTRTTQRDTNDPKLSELYDRFLDRRSNRSPATIAQYRRTIPTFLDFLDTKSVTSPWAISTELVDSYVEAIESCYEADSTVYTYTKNVRAWLRWLNKRGLCDQEVCQILGKDELGLSPKARDEALPASVAEQILQQLRNRRRGTAVHALLELLWNAGPRIGGVHSLDVADFDAGEKELQFEHRPESGTRLKNGGEEDDTDGDGERYVSLRDEAVDAVQLYISTERPSSTDEYGREPLFATSQGRATRSTLRRWVYRGTSCRWTPKAHGDENCDGNCNPDSDVCPNSYYPHAVRRGAIVQHLSGGLRPDLASERFDVSVRVIRKHYDPRTKRRRKQDREEAVQNSWPSM